MTGFEHMPSAGLEPEDLKAMEAESDLPGGWAPEDVRRFDDHQIRQAYPPHVSGTIMTTDGFKPVRGMPNGPFGLWGDKPSPEARAAYDAKIAATVAEDLMREGTPCQPFADAGRVVDDNPWDETAFIYACEPLALRRIVVCGVIVITVPLILILTVAGWVTTICQAVMGGIEGMVEALGHNFSVEWRAFRRTLALFRRGVTHAWRRR